MFLLRDVSIGVFFLRVVSIGDVLSLRDVSIGDVFCPRDVAIGDICFWDMFLLLVFCFWEMFLLVMLFFWEILLLVMPKRCVSCEMFLFVFFCSWKMFLLLAFCFWETSESYKWRCWRTQVGLSPSPSPSTWSPTRFDQFLKNPLPTVSYFAVTLWLTPGEK